MLSPLHIDIALPEQITQVTRSRYFHNLWLPIQLSRRDPQPHFPLHNHDFDEVAYIIKGHGVSFAGGKFRLLLPGNVTYLRAADTHAYPMVSTLRLLNIFFDHERLIENFPKLGSLLEEFQRLQASQSQIFTDYTAYTRLHGLADLLDMETFHSDDYSEYTAMAHLVEFIVMVLRQNQSRYDYRLKDGEQLVRSKILQIFADPSLPAKINRDELETLLDQHDLPWRSFERALSELAGLSPHNLCICNRFTFFLNALMDNPDANLEDIAAQSGFADYRSMSRNCRQFLGLSPKGVRDKIKAFTSNPPVAPPLGKDPTSEATERKQPDSHRAAITQIIRSNRI